MRKYEFTGEEKRFDGLTLRRIRAVRSFGNIEAGDLGGWIESDRNLSHDFNAWVYGNAHVYENARVCEHALVGGNALVSGNALVQESAWVGDNALVSGNAQISGRVVIYGQARVVEYADIFSQNHIISIDSITTTFYRGKEDKIYVVCGCFFGDLQSFLEKVEETYGNNRHGMVYRLAAELARTQIGGE